MPPRPEIHAFASGWKTLLIVHLAFTILAGTIAAPMVSGFIQGVVSISGQSALSDTAIIAFIFSPIGALAALAIGTMALCLQLLTYAALLIPARSLLREGICHAVSVPPLLFPALPAILRISLRFILQLILWSLPFATLIGTVHFILLGDSDINFHLTEKTPELIQALTLAMLVMIGHLLVIARLATGWVHAIPLAIFRGESPNAALRLSRQAVAGTRGVVFKGLVAWGLMTPLASALMNLPLSSIAMWSARHLHYQTGWLVVALGVCLALSIAVGWLAGFCGLSLLALQNMRLYQNSGLDQKTANPSVAPRHLPIGMKTAIAGGLAICVGTIFLSNLWIESLHVEREAVVIAHRGASLEIPENTQAAVRAAVEARADWVEIDVQESADGTVMVFHDSDFKRMGGPSKGIWELHDTEIGAIDIGSWKSPAFVGERTPRLSDILEICKDRSGVLIELKYYGHNQRLEERVVDIIEASGMTDQVMIMSLNHQGVAKIRQLRPNWKVGLLSTVALGNVTKLDLDFLGLNARTTSRRQLREAEKRRIKIYVWTVNDPVYMAAMLSRGVDGLITDNPSLARAVLTERGEATFGEKMLFDLAALLGRKPAATQQ